MNIPIIDLFLNKYNGGILLELKQDYKIIPIFNRKKNDKLMTPREFSEEYGIGVLKTYQLINCKGFPKIKNGRNYLILRYKVDEWLENNIGL